MKKIMFNDKYGLTTAVLEGRKTMTRRVITIPEKGHGIDVYGFCHVKGQASLELTDGDDFCIEDPRTGQCAQIMPTYRIGEEVAIARDYNYLLTDMLNYDHFNDPLYKKFHEFSENNKPYGIWGEAACTNKMFVKAELMPYRIRITNIKVERLQDISKEDCQREGLPIYPGFGTDKWYQPVIKHSFIGDLREAFAALIDKVSGRGTWDSNPWVFAYEFELLR